jgi:hypothetical protein
MNTTGIQNYLSNVFRPIYTYDTTSSNFIPKLTMSNIYNYTGNTISVFTAAVGDSNSNVYVGSNAGNPYDITRNVFNVTALGYGAASNISNDSNSIYIGWYAGSGGSNSTNVISIGTNSGGNGSENIFMGTDTGSVGTSNVLIGHFMDLSSSSNQVRIGYRNQIPIAADLSKNWVGLGGVLTPSYAFNSLDVSGNSKFVGNIGINRDPGNRTLDVNGNFRATDASANVLDFTNGLTRSSGGFYSDSSSITMSNTSSLVVGRLRRGVVMLNVLDLTDLTSFMSRTVYVRNPATPDTLIMTDVSSGLSPTLIFTTSNIVLCNTASGAGTRDYSWSITYFPSL